MATSTAVGRRMGRHGKTGDRCDGSPALCRLPLYLGGSGKVAPGWRQAFFFFPLSLCSAVVLRGPCVEKMVKLLPLNGLDATA